jgi:uncharacterized protein
MSPRTLRLRTSAGAIVCARCMVADTSWRRLKGLLGKSGLERDEGMLFTRTGSIHMFFMRFPIDVVFCDRELQVLKIVRGLRPWRTASARRAKVVVELAEGAAAGLEPGVRFRLE